MRVWAGCAHVGEHNARVLHYSVEPPLRSAELRLQIETPSGAAFITDPLAVDADGRGAFALGRTLLDTEGVLQAQLRAILPEQETRSDVMLMQVHASLIADAQAYDDAGVLIPAAPLIGRLSNLDTKDRSSLVAAINEVARSAGGLPPVTEDDDGAFMRVVDGLWKAVQLTNVAEVGA